MRPQRVKSKAIYLPVLEGQEAIKPEYQTEIPPISPVLGPVEVTGVRDSLLNLGRFSPSKSLLLLMTVTIATALLMSHP